MIEAPRWDGVRRSPQQALFCRCHAAAAPIAKLTGVRWPVRRRDQSLQILLVVEIAICCTVVGRKSSETFLECPYNLSVFAHWRAIGPLVRKSCPNRAFAEANWRRIDACRFDSLEAVFHEVWKARHDLSLLPQIIKGRSPLLKEAAS
jgi:hypothetical protein